MKLNMKYIIKIFAFTFFFMATGCGDLLENELPSNQVEGSKAIKSVQDMQQLLNAAYDELANSYNGNNQRFSELLADNVYIQGNSGFLVQVYNRSSDFFNSDVGGYYQQPYRTIARANSVLENLGKINASQSELDRFEGEAKFIRAICHFELVRLFAQPYGQTTDNSHLGIVIKTSTEIKPLTRSTVQEVYNQILEDLTDAEELLPETNSPYASVYSATAYLAKVYFQMNNYTLAAEKAEEVISNTTFSNDINNRYTGSISIESAFSIISLNANNNRASLFKDSYRSLNPNAPLLQCSDEYFLFLNGAANDLRAGWVEEKSYNGQTVKVFNKFDADFMSVCLASTTEMMLIAAESYGELNTNLSVAEGYLNDIKQRAGVTELNGASAAAIIDEARRERRKEFAGEGLRLHDLKRIGVSGETVIVRGAPWDCDGMVLQFPASEQSILGFVMNPQGGCN
jgi:starch-binding outer membrane protein, SusD/RagB family